MKKNLWIAILLSVIIVSVVGFSDVSSAIKMTALLGMFLITGYPFAVLEKNNFLWYMRASLVLLAVISFACSMLNVGLVLSFAFIVSLVEIRVRRMLGSE